MPGIEKSHHHPYPKDTMTNTTLALSGLTCGGCVKRAQAALAPWADDVTVTSPTAHREAETAKAHRG